MTFEGSKPEKASIAPKNALHGEHLKSGVRPIMACLIDAEDFIDKKNSWLRDQIWEVQDEDKGVEVEYGGSGHLTDVSRITRKNIFSHSYFNCIGIAAVGTGIGKDAGHQLGFLSHQHPDVFVDEISGPEAKRAFYTTMRRRLRAIRERTEGGTLDVVIFGGSDQSDLLNAQYLVAIPIVTNMIQDELGFDPVVMTGPNRTEGATDVALELQNRRLYIIRPRQMHDTNAPYAGSDMKNMMERWDTLDSKKVGE